MAGSLQRVTEWERHRPLYDPDDPSRGRVELEPWPYARSDARLVSDLLDLRYRTKAASMPVRELVAWMAGGTRANVTAVTGFVSDLDAVRALTAGLVSATSDVGVGGPWVRQLGMYAVAYADRQRSYTAPVLLDFLPVRGARGTLADGRLVMKRYSLLKVTEPTPTSKGGVVHVNEGAVRGMLDALVAMELRTLITHAGSTLAIPTPHVELIIDAFLDVPLPAVARPLQTTPDGLPAHNAYAEVRAAEVALAETVQNPVNVAAAVFENAGQSLGAYMRYEKDPWRNSRVHDTFDVRDHVAYIAFALHYTLTFLGAQRDFEHHDLHPGNVLVESLSPTSIMYNRPWAYRLPVTRPGAAPRYCVVPPAAHRNVIVKLIDFDRATMTPGTVATTAASRRPAGAASPGATNDMRYILTCHVDGRTMHRGELKAKLHCMQALLESLQHVGTALLLEPRAEDSHPEGYIYPGHLTFAWTQSGIYRMAGIMPPVDRLDTTLGERSPLLVAAMPDSPFLVAQQKLADEAVNTTIPFVDDEDPLADGMSIGGGGSADSAAISPIEPRVRVTPRRPRSPSEGAERETKRPRLEHLCVTCQSRFALVAGRSVFDAQTGRAYCDRVCYDVAAGRLRYVPAVAHWRDMMNHPQ